MNNSNIIINKKNTFKNTNNILKKLDNFSNKEQMINLETRPKNSLSSSKVLYFIPPINYPNLFINHKDIIIDEFGMQGINNNETKGKLTFFGIDPKYSDGNENEKELHKNDVIVSNEIMKKKINKTMAIFYIYYDNRKCHYMLKSKTKEIYLSYIIQPNTPIPLDNNKKNYVKIGKVILSITIKTDEKLIYIKIKKGETIHNEQNYYFSEDKTPINIGRTNCSINIKCDSVSKNHITIDYNKLNQKFFLTDNASTNGTQLVLNEGKTLQLSGDMNFNLGEQQFSIKEK